MTSALHDEPPRSAAVPHPPRRFLQSARPVARGLVRRRYDVRVHRAERVPAAGPVILAANHIGVLDGPLLAAFSPRAVHALTKHEMFEGRTGRFLRRSGQIPVDRFHTDPRAIRTCLRVLRDEGVVGVFPEGTRGDGELHRFHHGAAYLALVTGAPVVPVVILGSREPGGGIDSTPTRGSTIDLVYGDPWTTERRAWPRRTGMVRDSSALLRERLRETLDEARSLTGRDLPGPLPAGEYEDDPDTGFVDRGA
ncbi:lysophospholipid acyltransferase family protein [Nocardioides euryhalodurans]|uniref:1-acyl-sn-glycerol-3-phosphate acyltransferase n=1 Tax=Nocardioides euryhalodurans TaxID=2518370 RepID=A0A4P7GHE3_9ACTN|nr:lysophospholipid acyltransferase family protein [Nocardioides euryhalodurans]QBR91275.1 1-acyl-sn-glycerol-3-phosphate acyltransferase [Nocardioides euryhalodurans]